MSKPFTTRQCCVTAFLLLQAFCYSDKLQAGDYDTVQLSADGKYRFEARTKDVRGNAYRFYPRNYEYALYEVSGSKLIWNRKQGEKEGSPRSAYVHDDGWVIIETDWNHLVLFNVQGVLITEIDVYKDALPADEIKEYVKRTNIGNFWRSCSCWYFFKVAGEPCFGIRAWWDRRVLLSLNQGKLIADEGETRKAAEVAERTLVIRTLQLAAERVTKRGPASPQLFGNYYEQVWKDIDDLHSAIYLAGKLDLKEAKYWLKIMEQIPSFGSSGGRDNGEPVGEVQLEESRWDSTRQLIQLSIRRLGGAPAGYPVRRMFMQGPPGKVGKLYDPPSHQTPRSARVEQVRSGFNAKAVVDQIGAPDFIVYVPKPGTDDKEWSNFQGPYWDYGIDATPPYTLRILWKDRQVTKIEKIQPPVWKEGRWRDKELAH